MSNNSTTDPATKTEKQKRNLEYSPPAEDGEKVGYARVSTNKQNLDRQVDLLEEAGCTKIYKEKVSGAAVHKEKLQAALDYLREGDEFYVTRLKRLGRDLKDLIEKGERITHEIGADLICTQEQMDLSTPQGRFWFHVTGALAQFERERINERIQEGLESARERGQSGGRPESLSPAEVRELSTLVANRDDHDLTISQIAGRFEISDTTLYRYVGPEGAIRHMPGDDE
jgi:DNA invertase Pin-like site-specific DNA recombinase